MGACRGGPWPLGRDTVTQVRVSRVLKAEAIDLPRRPTILASALPRSLRQHAWNEGRTIGYGRCSGFVVAEPCRRLASWTPSRPTMSQASRD